ncbi:toll-like receptor 4 [Gigantopelta aegis]|uniref:toll-like receptor 4 n=1 Tax=Gigantopelta aegis TaxID=1735272 RepID=UPI001B88BCE9|nr:toll-like receptor 4 [Gigantopelta aegis]
MENLQGVGDSVPQKRANAPTDKTLTSREANTINDLSDKITHQAYNKNVLFRKTDREANTSQKLKTTHQKYTSSLFGRIVSQSEEIPRQAYTNDHLAGKLEDKANISSYLPKRTTRQGTSSDLSSKIVSQGYANNNLSGKTARQTYTNNDISGKTARQTYTNNDISGKTARQTYTNNDISGETTNNVISRKTTRQGYTSYVYNRSGEGLASIPTDIPINITVLDLSNNKISILPKNSFINLTNLNYINLSRNRIKLIENGSFSGLHLDWLDLSCNDIEKIEGGVFVSLVGHLNLSTNYISYLNRQSFFGAILFTLDISNNMLSSDGSFTDDVFVSQANSLISLRLHDNCPSKDSKSEYPDKALSVLVSLQNLTLHGWTRLFFGPGFQKMKALSRLRLGFPNCQTNALLGDTFHNLENTHLTVLDLSHCELVSVDSLAFKPLLYLQELDLSGNTNLKIYNALESLNSFCVRGHTRFMEKINFSRVNPYVSKQTIAANYTQITAKTASYLSQIALKSLDLSFNSLLNVSEDVFSGPILNSIVHLSLKGNVLNNTDITFSLLSRLSSARNLQTLDMSYQRKSFAEDPFKPRQCNRETSFLYDSQTTSRVGEIKFKLPPRLVEANFRQFDTGPSRPVSFSFVGRSPLAKVDYSGNCFSCDSVIKGLNTVTYLDVSNSACRHLNEVILHPFPNLETLFLDNSSLSIGLEADDSYKFLLRLTKITTISLAGNGFSKMFNSTFFRNQTKLQRLLLSRNDFDSIPINVSEFSQLEEIDLSFNKIETLSEDERNSLDNHTASKAVLKLHLRGNVLSCMCDNLDFILWLFSTNVTLDIEGDYTCILQDGTYSNTKFVFQSIQNVKLNCMGRKIFVIVISVCIVCISIILIAAVLYRHHWTIKYVLLKVRGRMMLFQELNEDESQNPYDAFVAYSQHDYQWVNDNIIQPLEEEKSFCLCIWERDFQCGLYITQNVTDSIHQSRRTIFIVTENYLQSEWCEFEMRMASIHAIQNITHRIIVILKDNIPPHRLPPFLKSVWDKTVCLPWSEDSRGRVLFLQKLERSLALRNSNAVSAEA